MSASTHILVIPFYGQGHLFPSIELCKRISSSLNCKITLIIPSSLSSSIPHDHHLFHVSLLTPPRESDSSHHNPHLDMAQAQPFTDLLSHLFKGPDPPTCAIIDVMIHWAHQPCKKFNIPTISFFTSSACSTSIEFALGKLKLSADDETRGESVLLPGLPEHFRVTLADIAHPPPHGLPPFMFGPHNPPPWASQTVEPKFGFGPPPPFKIGPGNPPPWASQTESSVALMFNTCEDLERPFIQLFSKEIEKPILCVGPLLPEEFTRSVGSIVNDHDLRTKRDKGNLSEEEVNQWLDSKSRGSVIYVSFGSEVGPTVDELTELAIALEESNGPFIWVLQSESNRSAPQFGPPVVQTKDFLPDGFVDRVQGRGLVIHGWAPQLLILSHGSTGGFISHCGWNSTLEAILRGVPLLTWPIRGDQHYNAKLIVEHLKVGLMIKNNGNQMERLKKDDILRGIEKLMAHEDIKKEAASLARVFETGLSNSYRASLDELGNFIKTLK